VLCSLTDDEGDENGRMKELGNRLTQLLYVHLRTCNMRLKRLSHDVQKVGAVLSGTYSSTAPTQSPPSHPTLVHHSHCNADPACSATEFVSMTSIQHRYSHSPFTSSFMCVPCTLWPDGVSLALSDSCNGSIR